LFVAAVPHFGDSAVHEAEDLHAAEDPDLRRAIFVLTFEAARATSQVQPYIRMWLQCAAETVEAGLRSGIDDGSVRGDIDVDRATSDFGAAVLGAAYQWIMQAYPIDMADESGPGSSRTTALHSRADRSAPHAAKPQLAVLGGCRFACIVGRPARRHQRCDTESIEYSYSFSDEIQQECAARARAVDAGA
jgi:hypothetical protein